jgi:predicted nucleic acid-binding protein
VPPPTLRALDAIHLASALTLGEDLAAVVTYDTRMFDAAERAQMPTLQPGHQASGDRGA